MTFDHFIHGLLRSQSRRKMSVRGRKGEKGGFRSKKTKKQIVVKVYCFSFSFSFSLNNGDIRTRTLCYAFESAHVTLEPLASSPFGRRSMRVQRWRRSEDTTAKREDAKVTVQRCEGVLSLFVFATSHLRMSYNEIQLLLCIHHGTELR